MKSRASIIILVLLQGISFTYCNAQLKTDSTGKHYKNVIRYNLSGPILVSFDKYIVFGYERVVNGNQSFSINGGTVALSNRRRDTSSIEPFFLKSNLKSTGFNISGDYRFYLKRENKYLPPRGIYIGPYFSYNKFHKESSWSYYDSSGHSKTTNTTLEMNIFSIGGEIGYQFILFKRFAVDFVVFGPGVGQYNVDLPASDILTTEEKSRLRAQVKQNMTVKYPGLNYVFDKREFDGNGKIHTWALGYRYIVHIGYLF